MTENSSNSLEIVCIIILSRNKSWQIIKNSAIRILYIDYYQNNFVIIK